MLSEAGFVMDDGVIARLAEDRETYTALFRTAELFGVLVKHGEGRRFLAGGPLGSWRASPDRFRGDAGSWYRD